jgi:putative ABC transport system permease protein
MNSLLQDLRYGLRTLRSRPAFSLVAVLILALGIGANIAIFSLINAVLLRPLPFRQPDRLAVVWEKRPATGQNENTVSGPEFLQWKDQNQVFDATAAFNYSTFNLVGDNEPETISAARVSSDFFTVIGTEPALGRSFTADEDRPGAQRVVILSDGLWKRRLGSDPGIVGQTVSLNDDAYTVVGVMPAGFQFPPAPPGLPGPELWTPLAAPLSHLWGLHNLFVVGRMKPSVTVEQAQTDLDIVAGRMEKQYPDSNTGHGVNVVSLREQMVGDVRPALLVFLGAVTLVLLIGCANIANLLLARAAGRQKEIAIRLALGASRTRLIRQLLTESLVLGVAGGLAGLLLAVWLVDLLPVISPADIPRLESANIDLRVVAAAAAVTLLSTVIFGLVPALQGTKPDINESLKQGARSSSGPGRTRIRSLLVTGEVALAMVLLTGAGLLTRSFVRLAGVDPGFDPGNVLTAQIPLSPKRYPRGRQQADFYERLFEKIRALPGVKNVGAINNLPLSGSENNIPVAIGGREPAPPGHELRAGLRVVSPNYFRTMSIPLQSGRFFVGADARASLPLIRWYDAQPFPPRSDEPQPAPVALINETMARSFWPGEDPVGKRIRLLFSPWITVAGVVRNTRHEGLDSEPKPEVYLSSLQEPQGAMTLVIRSSGDPAALVPLLRQEVRSLDQEQPITDIRTMGQVFSNSIGRPRFNALLVGIFGIIALTLAAVGVFGVVSFSVAQRTQEIGIRMVLGAQSRNVLGLVVRQGMLPVLAGVVFGLGGALVLTRLISGLLYGVSPADPATFIVIGLILTLVSLAACYLPARRATKVDPMVALRYE